VTLEIDEWAANPAFQAADAPYAILDREFRICAANAAYETATTYPRTDLLGESIFDVFPNNPADPAADGVARLTESLETVLARGARHRMPSQRHDIRDRTKPSGFLYKVWAPTNSPIPDARGRTTAILHHTEDVTRFFPAAPSSDGPALHTVDDPLAEERWSALFGALRHEREVSDHLRQQVETLREALDTNRQISVAVGLLMAATGLHRDDAFKLLVRQSQSAHRKLRDLASDLVREHEGR
jgi:hypothetical protein